MGIIPKYLQFAENFSYHKIMRPITPTRFSVSKNDRYQPSPKNKKDTTQRMSISRLFRPGNDKSILRNLISDQQGWEKVISKPLAAEKKSKLVELNQLIDAFAVRWAFKGMGVFWNPQFVTEYLSLKIQESKQQVGQKIFSLVWLHPLLHSVRIAKFCPAIGYAKTDLQILAEATAKLENQISINNNQLAVINDSFHSPDGNNDDDDDEEDDREIEMLTKPDILDELVITEEIGMREHALDTSNQSDPNRSLRRQDAIDEDIVTKINQVNLVDTDNGDSCKAEAGSECKEELKDEKPIKCEPFDIRTILCSPYGGYNQVKEEPKPITIIGFHPPNSLPAIDDKGPSRCVLSLPEPKLLADMGKIFADTLATVASATALACLVDKIEILEIPSSQMPSNHQIFESADVDGEFSDDLETEYT